MPASYCPNCGTEVVEMANYCAECGAELPPDPDYGQQHRPDSQTDPLDSNTSSAGQTGSRDADAESSQTPAGTGQSPSSASQDSGGSLTNAIPGMRPGQLGVNLIIGSLYLIFSWLIIALFPLFMAVWLGLNAGQWADRLSGLPGVRTGGGFLSTVSGLFYGVIIWIFVMILIGAVLSGGALTPSQGPDAGSAASTPTSGQAIEGPPEALLPTIDDFDADWREHETEQANTTSFYNTQTEAFINYEVTIYDSNSDARDAYQDNRGEVRSRGQGTESVDIGDDGFFYKPVQSEVVVYFVEGNVVGRTQFYGENVLTPESNAINFARKLHDSVVN